MRKLILLLSMVLSPAVLADAPIVFFNPAKYVMSEPEITRLPWQVGEYANYDFDMGFFKGTMEMLVREEVPEGFWVEQNLDILGQKQKVEILFDLNTGAILELIVNGEKQDIPDNPQPEIVETREERITVPAGSFDTVYAKLRNPDNGEETQIWFNPDIVPISGMVKNISPSQFGEVTLSLTSYLKK